MHRVRWQRRRLRARSMLQRCRAWDDRAGDARRDLRYRQIRREEGGQRARGPRDVRRDRRSRGQVPPKRCNRSQLGRSRRGRCRRRGPCWRRGWRRRQGRRGRGGRRRCGWCDRRGRCHRRRRCGRHRRRWRRGTVRKRLARNVCQRGQAPHGRSRIGRRGERRRARRHGRRSGSRGCLRAQDGRWRGSAVRGGRRRRNARGLWLYTGNDHGVRARQLHGGPLRPGLRRRHMPVATHDRNRPRVGAGTDVWSVHDCRDARRGGLRLGESAARREHACRNRSIGSHAVDRDPLRVGSLTLPRFAFHRRVRPVGRGLSRALQRQWRGHRRYSERFGHPGRCWRSDRPG
jgi:hypothetical protein